MRQYLIDTFKFNDQANKKVLDNLKKLPDQKEAIKFFSHLIRCQYKWMARIKNDPKEPELSWWEPLYTADQLEVNWSDSLILWLAYLETITDKELEAEVTFTGNDGSRLSATPCDIALQLNYHSIHHRAQMQTIIRQQGLKPAFVDYIGTKYRKLG